MISPIFYTDFYKTCHHEMYPPGTQFIYSNFTPRYSRLKGIDRVVVFGIQYFVKEYLIRQFNENFFGQSKQNVLGHYKKIMDAALGVGKVDTSHLSDLHDLGYLPILIKALPEGTRCPLRVPVLTIVNTHEQFFWLTNFLETLLSNVLWHPMTSATIADEYRRILNHWAKRTSDSPDFVEWQGHDFSMRGHASVESATVSAAAHLLSFKGTDTVPAIPFLEEYYRAEGFIGGSVPATEHSVMCMGGEASEYETYKRLLTEVYPSGVVSIVSDTWDYWKVLTETIPSLKKEILARDGKFVVRPDSGDPELILCGDPDAPQGSPAWKGTVRILFEIFGGHINSKGYIELNPKIGVIYGDSITLERCQNICYNLEANCFASTNVVFGIGSYTYQYVTRDTFGFAMKATWGMVNNKPVELCKTPKTDVGIKHSAKGLLRVNEDLTLSEGVTTEEEWDGLLQPVFQDGVQRHPTKLEDIRKRLLWGN